MPTCRARRLSWIDMEPPAELKRPNKLWKLKKSVYGMNDAGRKWYFKVEKVLTGLGCEKSRYDHCLFTYKVNGQLPGILLRRQQQVH